MEDKKTRKSKSNLEISYIFKKKFLSADNGQEISTEKLSYVIQECINALIRACQKKNGWLGINNKGVKIKKINKNDDEYSMTFSFPFYLDNPFPY